MYGARWMAGAPWIVIVVIWWFYKDDSSRLVTFNLGFSPSGHR